ncbi:MAG: leucyl aminopeptidase family protein [Woeseia sp.]
MSSLLSDKFNSNKLSISQIPGTPSAETLNGLDQLLLILPEKIPAPLWNKIPQGAKFKTLLKRRRAGSVPSQSGRINNKRQTAVHIGQANTGSDIFDDLTLARKLVAAALTEKPVIVGVWVLGFDDDRQQRIAECTVAAAMAAAFTMPTFKKDTPKPPIKGIRLIGMDERVDLRRIEAEASGNNLARWLTSLPPNKLDGYEYVKVLRDLAREQGWQFKKYGLAELAKMGAGAFLAVAQGNEDDSASMVRLRYRPDGKRESPALSLVGKGIIFDTGGTNLKPFNSMLDMHIDMGGSAVAVGSLLAMTELEFPHAVDCWLAITENRTGPMAYKSQDVITAANGKTIQTVHTDAEGRMALADALHFACKDKPQLVIDYATLTGACMVAVTTRYSGVFTNRPDLHPVLKKCGRDSGERVWPFPIGKEFLSELSSDTADIKQCSPNGGGDHILAATFLNEFVDSKVPWVHIDLSACNRKGGLAHIPTNITGFGVRYTMNLLLDQDVLASQALGGSD